MSKVLVIGGSRGIGLETVKVALSQGHEVRAFSRTAHRLPLTHESLEKQSGSALDRDDMERGLQGVDAVVQSIGVKAGPDLVLKPVSLFSESTSVLLSAMRNVGVKRLVSVTGFGAGDSRKYISCVQRIPFGLLLGRAYDDKNVQEDLIRASDLDWVIARPVILTNGPKTGRYRVLTSPEDWRNGFISRANVAQFLVAQIDDDTHLRQTPVLVACSL